MRRIFVRDGKLTAISGAFADVGAGTELTPVSANRFLFPGGTVALEFVPAMGGRAQEARVLEEGRKPVVFQQVKAFAPSSTELRAFAGEYTSPELGVTYTLVVRDSGLLLQLPRGTAELCGSGGRDLCHLLRPTFTDAFQEDRIGVRFTRDARGTVTGFLLHYTTVVRSLRFDRVKR